MSNEKLIKNASYFSIIIGAIVLSIKSYTWINTGSISVFASFVDSLLDITSSMINAIAIYISLIPADDNHRFGHSKVQDLAVFGQGIFFIGSGLLAIFVAIKNLSMNHHSIDIHEVTQCMGICVMLNIILICYQPFVIKKTNSNIIKSDMSHYVVDLAGDLFVIISVYFSKYLGLIDIIGAIIISAYIIISSIKLLASAIRNLIDEEFKKDDKEKILNILRGYSEVKGVHELKTRRAGHKSFIQLHIELDGNMVLLEAHKITENIIDSITQEFKDTEVIIHQDPAGFEQNVKYKVY